MRLSVRVTPRGGRDAVDGWTRDDAGRPVLKVRVAAAAADGKANAAVIGLRAPIEAIEEGLDMAEHGERAWNP